MGKANARNKIKKSYLDEINQIDRRLKRVKKDEEQTSKLLKKRELIKRNIKENINIKKYGNSRINISFLSNRRNGCDNRYLYLVTNRMQYKKKNKKWGKETQEIK